MLNDYVDVSDATRERVLKVARELDYTPSAAARTLVMQRSQVIGVVLETGEGHPDLQHPFFQEVLVGLKHRLGAGGYDLLLFATENPGNGFSEHSLPPPRPAPPRRRRGRDGRRRRATPRSRSSHASLDPVRRRRPRPRRAAHRARDLGQPRRARALAVRHLHEQGHERIAIVTGMLSTRPGADRLLGYRAELEALGLRYRDDYVQEGDFYFESGYAGMQALLDLDEPPTAVFAAGDVMAAGCDAGESRSAACACRTTSR